MLVEQKRIFAEEILLEVATKSNPRIISGYMEIPSQREKILKRIRSKSWKYIERKYIKPTNRNKRIHQKRIELLQESP